MKLKFVRHVRQDGHYLVHTIYYFGIFCTFVCLNINFKILLLNVLIFSIGIPCVCNVLRSCAVVLQNIASEILNVRRMQQTCCREKDAGPQERYHSYFKRTFSRRSLVITGENISDNFFINGHSLLCSQSGANPHLVDCR